MPEQILSRFVEGPKERGKLLLPTLTDRATEVSPLIGEGLGIGEISLRLHLSVKTIGTCRKRIKEKPNLKNSTKLLRYALNWVENRATQK